MADSTSDQEKTLPATPKRLEQAREEGQIPRSKALGSAIVLALAATAFMLMGPALAGSMRDLLRRGLAFDHDTVLADGAMTDRLSSFALDALAIGLPLCALMAAGAFLSPFVLGGVLFSGKALEPKWTRLDPIGGVQRMLSGQNLAELAKTIVEAVVVLAVIAIYVWQQLGNFGSLLEPSQHGPMSALTDMVMFGFLLVVAAITATALFDIPLQLWRHSHSLRMSMDEVKRETRESEGDPHLKAKVRSIQREMAKKRMMSAVPKANVIITNPTHYAVALAYEEAGNTAPRVVAKGAGLIARKIRELAAEAGVPMVEAPPLARALYAHSELGDEIPQTLFTAVAQVLAFVFRLRSDLAAIEATPYSLPGLEVPAGLDPRGEVAEEPQS